MAHWDGGASESEDQFYGAPSRTRQRMIQPPTTLIPDTEEHVRNQTSDVFSNFMFQSYRQDQMDLQYDPIPHVDVFSNFTEEPQSPSSEIGRQLAVIGDGLNEKYADLFEDMIRKLKLTPDTAYEAFEGVAKKLFATEMNWGRIVMLLFFGYRMAMSVLRTHFDKFSSFLSRITSYVVRFIISERIAQWIADHGGWRAGLSFVPSVSMNQMLFIGGMAFFSVLAVYLLNKK